MAASIEAAILFVIELTVIINETGHYSHFKALLSAWLDILSLPFRNRQEQCRQQD